MIETKNDHSGGKRSFLFVPRNTRYRGTWLLTSVHTQPGQGPVAMSLSFLTFPEFKACEYPALMGDSK